MPRNPRLEALRENVNMIGMAGFAGLSMLTGSLVPLLTGVVIEVAYLLFLPDSAWYRDVIRTRDKTDADEAERQRRGQLLNGLRPYVRGRYDRLVSLRKEIQQAMEGDSTYYSGVVQNLDLLQDKFLMFATKEDLFSRYLQSLHLDALRALGWTQRNDTGGEWTPPGKSGKSEVPLEGYLSSNDDAQTAWVKRAIDAITSQFDHDRETLAARIDAASGDEESDTRAILQKRMDVLGQRQEYVRRIGRTLISIRSQLELVQETFGLINDQIRARDPQQVLEDIESAVYQTESTTRLLDEIAPLEQMVVRVGAGN